MTVLSPIRYRGPAAWSQAMLWELSKRSSSWNLQTRGMGVLIARLPTTLVAKYRAVDRDRVGSALFDTPSHLDALTDDIRVRGILVPLQLGFNADFGVLDGNHRVAVAIRLGLDDVPVVLTRKAVPPVPPTHSRCVRRT